MSSPSPCCPPSRPPPAADAPAHRSRESDGAPGTPRSGPSGRARSRGGPARSRGAEDIASGLVALRDEIVERGIKSIAVPPLGCGNGGLPWRDVEPVIHQALGTVPGVEVRVHEPSGAPAASSMPNATQAPSMT
ncbi:macro domain-containing protein [Streptomyces sp. NPDC052077]|uniref:macro domain-containing protein n=1 Tax=Streptomyces sp. NPDC052077 TaxID=3154757 RepID=UPI003430CB60